MSQNDLNIANQSATNFRSDLNNALQALGSNNSGSSDPSTTYANMFYYDTSANILRIRNEADSAFINVGFVNQSQAKFNLFDDTNVVNTSGTQTGLLGDQATSAWEAGTSTTESLVSPAKIKSAIDTVVNSSGGIKAFCNFDGEDGSILKSGNIASVTRTAEGKYNIVFSSAMPDANYIITTSAISTDTSHTIFGAGVASGTLPTTSGFTLSSGETGGASAVGRSRDASRVYFSVIA